MKLKESQLIILNVSPIYAKTDQSKVANNQISSESCAAGKIYLTLKRWLIQPRWFMSNDLALSDWETAINFTISISPYDGNLVKLTKMFKETFLVLFLFLLKWKKPVSFFYIKQLKILNTNTHWEKMYHSWQGNVTATGQAVKQTEGKLPKPPCPFQHPDEISWKCWISSNAESISTKAATA